MMAPTVHQNYTESGVKFASVENIGNLYATRKYISEKDFEKYKIKPRIGDVMMTRIGSVGVCTVVDRNEALAFYVSLALLRPQLDKVQSRFLKYAIESIHGRKELRKRTLINAVPIKINKDDIGKVTIPLPPIEIHYFQKKRRGSLSEFSMPTVMWRKGRLLPTRL